MKKLHFFLNIDFLINDNAFKNWRMIVFLSVLALIMIASGHSADRKIFQIAKLNNEVKILKNELVEGKKKLAERTKEAVIQRELKGFGLVPSKTPAVKIIVTKE